MTEKFEYKMWNKAAVGWTIAFAVTLLWMLAGAIIQFARGAMGWAWVSLVIFLAFLVLDAFLVRGWHRIAYNQAINERATSYLDTAGVYASENKYDEALVELAKFDKLPRHDRRFWTLKSPGVV